MSKYDEYVCFKNIYADVDGFKKSADVYKEFRNYLLSVKHKVEGH